MNRPGKINDNAHIESFFHSMKAEELYAKTFATDEQLRQALSSSIAFYNDQRLPRCATSLQLSSSSARARNRASTNVVQVTAHKQASLACGRPSCQTWGVKSCAMCAVTPGSHRYKVARAPLPQQVVLE
jgi:transposase InsO family protein